MIWSSAISVLIFPETCCHLHSTFTCQLRQIYAFDVKNCRSGMGVLQSYLLRLHPTPHMVSLPNAPDLTMPLGMVLSLYLLHWTLKRAAGIRSDMQPIILILPWPLLEAQIFPLLFPPPLCLLPKHWPQAGEKIKSSFLPHCCSLHSQNCFQVLLRPELIFLPPVLGWKSKRGEKTDCVTFIFKGGV